MSGGRCAVGADRLSDHRVGIDQIDAHLTQLEEKGDGLAAASGEGGGGPGEAGLACVIGAALEDFRRRDSDAAR
jgi:hypothetical protein